MAVSKTASAEEEEKAQRLPDLTDGEMATVVSIELKNKATRAPKPYTEGTLLDDMQGAAKYVDDPKYRKVLRQKEVSGIGTAATRAETIEKLKAVKYIKASGRSITATEKGMDFILWLDKVYPEITDVALTARWQADLDVVAESGGGKAFETRVAESVRQMVAIFKAAPPMRAITTSSSEGSSSMTDTTSPRKPTDKMLEFAKRIAAKLNQELPQEVMVDGDACSKYIDANREAAMRPTDKQLKFAESIAKDRGIEVPEDVKKDGRELSKWIDENKA